MSILIVTNSDYNPIIKTKYPSVIVVTNSEALKIIDYSNFQLIVVLCELEWDQYGKTPSPGELYGVKMVSIFFRAYCKLRQPVLFISNLSKVAITYNSQNMIVDAVGHDFMKIDDFINSDESNILNVAKRKSLSDIQMDDILINFCDLKGQIGEIIHRAKNNINKIDQSSAQAIKIKYISEIIKVTLDDIFNLLGTIPDSEGVKAYVFDVLNTKIISENNLAEATAFMTNHEEMLRSLANDSETLPAPIAIDRPWEVLILDDEPECISQVIDTLRANGIKVIISSNVDEAQAIIEDDERLQKEVKNILNSITVVISDYRLFVNGTKRQQHRQGYDFLVDTSRRNRFTSYVALSGLGRQFLLTSFRKYNLRIDVYSKDDLSTSLRNQQVFAENIIQLGENQYDALSRVPSARGWNSEGKRCFYIEHRKRTDYFDTEHLINKKARQYVQNIIHLLSDVNSITFPALNSDEFKGLTTSLQDIERQMPVFRKVLLARRIVLWLIFVEGFTIKRVYGLLSSGVLDVTMLQLEPEQLRTRSTNLINTNLCITVQTFPDDILLEERAWFLYDMGVNIDDLGEVLSQVQQHFQFAIDKYPEIYSLLKEEFEDHFVKDTNNEHFIVPSIGSVKRILSFIDERVNELQAIDLIYEILSNTIECLKYDKTAQVFMMPLIHQSEELLRKIYSRKCGNSVDDSINEMY